MDRRAVASVAAFVLLISSAAANERDFFACASCHGAGGEGMQAKAAPAIAGLDAAYIQKQMLDFKSGVRGAAVDDTHGQQMALLAAPYDLEAVSRLASYVSTLPRAATARSDVGDALRGRTLYALCVQCHGGKGEGSPTMGAPRLAGLGDWYLVRQLENYRDGRRGYRPNDAAGRAMALTVRQGLTGPTDHADVAAYVESLTQ